jgi:hypothetical protein
MPACYGFAILINAVMPSKNYGEFIGHSLLLEQ